MKRTTLLILLVLATAVGCGDAPASDPAPSPAEPDRPIVRVRVVGEDDVPIPGATVRLRLTRGAGPEGLRGILATSDEDGFARLDVAGVLSPGADVPAHLGIVAPGYVPRQWPLPTWGPGTGLKLTATLIRAAIVPGRVRDEAGEPVEGAFVYLIRTDLAGVVSEDEVIGTHTDAEGLFRIDNAPPGVLDLGIRAKGFVPLLREDIGLVRGKETPLPPLALARGGEIRGIVTTPEGEPIPDARVRAWRDRTAADFQYPGRRSSQAPGCVAVTDGQGRFCLDGLAPANYTVDASRHGYETVDAARSDVAPGEEELSFTLRAGFILHVLIVDMDTGKPIGKFRLISAEREGETDLQGRPLVKDDREVVSPAGTADIALRRGAHYALVAGAEGYDIATADIGPVSDVTAPTLTMKLRPRK